MTPTTGPETYRKFSLALCFLWCTQNGMHTIFNFTFYSDALGEGTILVAALSEEEALQIVSQDPTLGGVRPVLKRSRKVDRSQILGWRIGAGVGSGCV